MSDLTGRLKSLAAMESTYPHILTAYLNIRRKGKMRAKECDIFLRNRVSEIESVLSGDSRAKQFLKKEVSVVERILEQDLPRSANSIALFIRNGEVFERFETNFEFEDQIAYRRVPHIAQLAFMDEELQSSMVVVLDSRHAKIFDVTLGVSSGQGEISSDVLGRIQSGGWSQMRYQRHIDNQKREHLEDVVAQIEEIVQRFNHQRIVLIGPDATTSRLMDMLPKHLKNRVVERGVLNSRAKERDILEQALQYFAQAENAEEEEKVRRARIEIHSTGMAVAGVDNVLRHLMRGQAYELLLAGDFQEQGAECRECGSIAHGSAGRLGKCPSCDANGESLKDVDLREFMTRKALQFGVKLEFMKTPAFRESLGNAAAMLYSPSTA